MDSWEIELKLRKASAELEKMQSDYEQKGTVSYTNGSDMQYRTMKGTEEEHRAIIGKRQEVMNLQRELEEARSRERAGVDVVRDAALARLGEEKNHLGDKEEEHRMAFDRVKQTYKSRSRWERLKDSIQGKRPNWSKIESYTTEELEFLNDLARGNTLWQRKVNEDKFERRQDKGMTIKEIQAKQKEEAMKAFMDSVNSQNTLTEKMNLDDTLAGGKTI